MREGLRPSTNATQLAEFCTSRSSRPVVHGHAWIVVVMSLNFRNMHCYSNEPLNFADIKGMSEYSKMPPMDMILMSLSIDASGSKHASGPLRSKHGGASWSGDWFSPTIGAQDVSDVLKIVATRTKSQTHFQGVPSCGLVY